jgi:SAM-dependent methyltransferase
MAAPRGAGYASREYAAAWDSEYARGRYAAEPPVAFVRDVVSAVRDRGLVGARGVDIGCGNGRNLVPLANAGLRMAGLDVSSEGLRQLARRLPETRLVRGTVAALQSRLFGAVVGIQVFQHGDGDTAVAHVRAAAELVCDGGLLCVRVNAIGTDVWPEHEVIEEEPGGSFTIRYLAGAKSGLAIHFFSEPELRDAVGEGFAEVVPPRLHATSREPPASGRWRQWEGIWCRTS